MEDWLHFAETFAPCVFSGDVIPVLLLPLWEALSCVIQHYFRPRPADETKEDFRKAAAEAGCNLRHYAVGLETLLQQNPNCTALARLFTINLHSAVCRYVIYFFICLCICHDSIGRLCVWGLHALVVMG